ncbi:MAG: galactose-1-phosphate uridylyltransferase [Planctomycetales bacterium]|nr:galactose-1-phosphate uridylyltransferase [Planctomycetales bacterium]
MRLDPITGRKVLIAEDRAGRPNDFVSAEVVQPTGAASCPFCVGHERETPRPLLEILDEQGDWQLRVIPNKFPVVSSGADSQKEKSSGLFTVQAALGAHEVIIESPRHFQDFTDLSLEQLTSVLLVYRDRLRHWSVEGRIRHVTVFKNVGYAAGASLEHVHSQLLALPFVPDVIGEEMQCAVAYYEREQECIFCRLLREEFASGQRLVCREGGFAAICAYAGRQPFETWVLPEPHAPSFTELTNDEAKSLAVLLRQLLRKLQTQLKPLSYNLLLHTAPFGEAKSSCYHWHLEIVPRTAQLAGLEWGSGLLVSSLAPERAAKLLREADG